MQESGAVSMRKYCYSLTPSGDKPKELALFLTSKDTDQLPVKAPLIVKVFDMFWSVNQINATGKLISPYISDFEFNPHWAPDYLVA